jgi:hypothetical protein
MSEVDPECLNLAILAGSEDFGGRRRSALDSFLPSLATFLFTNTHDATKDKASAAAEGHMGKHQLGWARTFNV